MSKLTIKLRVTLWYAFFMILIILLMFGFIFSIGQNLTKRSAQNNLKEMVNKSFQEIKIDHGSLEIDDDLDFFEDGIYISIYNNDLKLLYGRTPSGFDQKSTFKSDTVQAMTDQSQQWYIYDNNMLIGEDENVWVRGVVSFSSTDNSLSTMLKLALIIFPIILIFVIASGYFITKKAFEPIEKIRLTAQQIGESNNLSRRIQLGEGNDELYSLSRTFDDMLSKLESAFQRERQFTSDASHELRTPVSVIMSQCEYALKNAHSLEEAQRSLEVILGQSKKMTQLISQLLSTARFDNAIPTLHLEIVNLSELFEIVTEEQSESAEKSKVTVKTNIPPEIKVEADQTMMIRLLTNLVSNAVSYNKEGGIVEVSLGQNKDQVIGIVKDNGIGISQSELPKIWDRFYQAEVSRTQNASFGAGLGLSMVKSIIDHHHGKISVTSTLGKGSEFIFTVPLKQP